MQACAPSAVSFGRSASKQKNNWTRQVVTLASVLFDGDWFDARKLVAIAGN
jgi:hypothetical protein